MGYNASDTSDFHGVLSAELIDTRRKVADLLFHFPVTKAQQQHLSMRDIALILGTSRDLVNNSLIMLKQEGALSIERHKMAINRNALERILINND